MDRKPEESRQQSEKVRKEKRQKITQERRESQRDKRQRSRSRSRQKKVEKRQYSHTQALTSWKGEAKEEEKPEKTHVSCRRCKENTFSLINRTCSNCGYPKQSRPNYFPVAKQVQVLDLVRQGKLVHNSYAPMMIEVVVNDRMGKKQRIKCSPTDTVLQFKKLISAQIGTRPDKIRLQKANIIFKDHISLQDYEIKDGMGLQMYYD